MTDITIPPGALTASKEEVATMLYAHPYKSLSGGKKDVCDNIAYAACLAMLRSWPGMEYDPGALVTDAYRDPGKIILPLPKEASDE